MMSTRSAALLLAAVLIIVGIVIGTQGVSATDTVLGNVQCGSAFFRDNSTLGPDAPDLEQQMYLTLRSECDGRIATQRAITYPILGIGILAALFIGLTSMSGAGRKNDPPAATKATEGSSDGASAV